MNIVVQVVVFLVVFHGMPINPMVGAGAMMVSNQLAQQHDASGGLLPPDKRGNAPLANGVASAQAQQNAPPML